MKNFFSPIEESYQKIEPLLKAKTIGYNHPSTLKAISELNLNEKQLKYLSHAMKELSQHNDFEKIINGALKHDVLPVAMLLLKLNFLPDSAINYFYNHLDEFPAEMQAPILSVLCYKKSWLNENYKTRFISMLESDENKRFVPERLLKEDTITVYKAMRWDQSIQDCIEDACWQTDLNDAAGIAIASRFPFCDKDIQEDLGYTLDDERGKDIRSVKNRVLSAKIKTKDILTAMDASYFLEGHFDVLEIVQSRSVFDIEIVDADTVLDEMIDWIIQNTNLMQCDRYMYIDDDELPDEFLKDYNRINDQCTAKGLPSYGLSSKVTNKKIVNFEEMVEMLSIANLFPKEKVKKAVKGILKKAPGAQWVYCQSKGVLMKRNYFYRAIAYNQLINDFLIVPCRSHVTKKSDRLDLILEREGIKRYLEGKGYSTEIKAEDFVRYTSIFAYDAESEAKTLEEFITRVKKIDNPEDDEKSIKEKVKKEIVYLAPALSEEEKSQLKKEYQDELDSMYQEEILSSKTVADSKLSEIEQLKSINAGMRNEIENLKKQIEQMQKKIDLSNNVPVVTAGKEKEKFTSEAKAFVMSAIEKEIKNSKKGTRRRDVLKDIYDSNSDGSEKELSEKCDRIKKITKGYRHASEIQSNLEKEGFVFQQIGGHPTIRYKGDDRYIITVASTPSDSRAGDNLAKEIERKFY